MAVLSNNRKNSITPQILSKLLGIGLKTAADNFKATTKMGYQYQKGKFVHRYRTEQRQMKYQRIDCILYTDTSCSKRKFKQSITCGQLFLTYFNFFHFRGITSKKLACIALAELFEIFRVPRHVNRNNAKELTSAPHWRRVREKPAGIHTTHIKHYIPW